MINYKILSVDHKDWGNVLKNFDEKISNDIYQSKEYLKLYENYNQKKSESFLFSLNNNYFFLSYIKNQIILQTQEIKLERLKIITLLLS